MPTYNEYISFFDAKQTTLQGLTSQASKTHTKRTTRQENGPAFMFYLGRKPGASLLDSRLSHFWSLQRDPEKSESTVPFLCGRWNAYIRRSANIFRVKFNLQNSHVRAARGFYTKVFTVSDAIKFDRADGIRDLS